MQLCNDQHKKISNAKREGGRGRGLWGGGAGRGIVIEGLHQLNLLMKKVSYPYLFVLEK